MRPNQFLTGFSTQPGEEYLRSVDRDAHSIAITIGIMVVCRYISKRRMRQIVNLEGSICSPSPYVPAVDRTLAISTYTQN